MFSDPKILVLIATALILIGVFLYFSFRRHAQEPAPSVSKPETPKPSKWALKGLGAIGRVLRPRLATEPEGLQDLEDALLQADFGPAIASQFIQEVQKASDTDPKQVLVTSIENALAGVEHGMPKTDLWPKPCVISVVGINGAGKTTSIGKLSHLLTSQGKKVLIGACDTFRAAATEQLRVWAERSGSEFVFGREGGDPGAVAFDSVKAGMAREMDVVLLDTAGRLHTKTGLVDELKRVHRVTQKVIPDSPHQIWLVLDGTLGQNLIRQAEEFTSALGVTGLIITKLDGSAKGGALVPIVRKLRLPVRFVGLGEGIADLVPFAPSEFAKGIVDSAPA